MAGTDRRIKAIKRRAHEALKADDLETAFQAITDALSIDMDDPEALYMAGVFFRNRGHSGMAAQMFRRCVALDPKHPNPWMHFAATLHDMHHYDEAIEAFKVVKQMVPQDPMVYANIGASLQQKGEFAEALNYANEALKRKKDLRNARTVKALASLGMERWKDGFDDYRALYGGQLLIRTYCQPEEPEWKGQKDQTVVIQCDQGLGDEIRYCSVLEDLAKDCKKVILDCHPKLEKMLQRAFPTIDVYGTRKKAEGVTWLENYQIDARYHISGLGRFYRTKDKDFPRKPYLIPRPDLVEKWEKALEDLPRPLVGIAWQGGSIGTGKEFRSTLLEEWKGLIDQGGSFIDLSYHDSESEVEAYNTDASRGVVRFDIDQSDYDETLALLSLLDLVICVPTTVMHARGALGLPCWVLVPQWKPWEFGVKRDDLIWYQPGCIKLFRSQEADFTKTIAAMGAAFGDYLNAAGVHRPGPAPALGLYRTAKLHYKAGKQASPDNAIDLASITYQEEGPDGVHLQPVLVPVAV